MIRKGLTSDARAIAQVHIASWQAAYRDLMPAEYLRSLDASLPQRESNWLRMIESGETTVFVAQVNDEVVGWISVGASRDADAAAHNAGEVMAIYVLAGHWQTGVGKALWNAGVQFLMDQGFSCVTLWVLEGNQRAIRFYRKAGCTQDVESERNLARGGVALVEVRYRLPLA